VAEFNPMTFNSATEAKIESLTANNGIYVASDTGYIWVWNDNHGYYVQGPLLYDPEEVAMKDSINFFTKSNTFNNEITVINENIFDFGMVGSSENALLENVSAFAENETLELLATGTDGDYYAFYVDSLDAGTYTLSITCDTGTWGFEMDGTGVSILEQNLSAGTHTFTFELTNTVGTIVTMTLYAQADGTAGTQTFSDFTLNTGTTVDKKTKYKYNGISYFDGSNTYEITYPSKSGTPLLDCDIIDLTSRVTAVETDKFDTADFASFAYNIVPEDLGYILGGKFTPFEYGYFEHIIATDIELNGTDLSATLTTMSTATSDLDTRVTTIEKDYAKIDYGTNLFNKDDEDIANGYGLWSNGEPTENSEYYISGYIPVEPNKTYITNSNGGSLYTAFYDLDKNFLGTSSLVSAGGNFTVTTIADTYFMRVTFIAADYNPTIDGIIIAEGTELPVYSSYTENARIYNIEKIPFGTRVTADTFSDGEALDIPSSNIKNKNVITFDATILNFTEIRISHGLTEAYGASRIVLTATTLSVWDTSSGTETLISSELHGLTISEHISVVIDVGNIHEAKVTITVPTGIYTTSIVWYGCENVVKVQNNTCEFSNVEFIHYCKAYNEKIWAFGDSYFDMWPLMAEKMGFDNVMFDGYGGNISTSALTSLKQCLKFKIPATILWCLGMNDSDTVTEINADYKATLDELIEICNTNHIKLIITTIPNTPIKINTFKNDYIKSSGYAYIDVAEAVGGSDLYSTWYSGLLTSDQIHPSYNYGRAVIATKIISSLPELSKKDKRAYESELSMTDGTAFTITKNELVYKDGVVYVRFQGTANKDVTGTFAAMGTIWNNTFEGDHQSIFGEDDYGELRLFIGPNQGNIFTNETIKSGSFVSFMFSYYLGEWNYDTKL